MIDTQPVPSPEPAPPRTSAIEVTFPGGKQVDAVVGGHHIRTDQPASLGGEGSAPAPFELFLASLATCAGIYALGFCQARGLPTEGLRLRQVVEEDPQTHLPASIRIEITPPVGFPEKYVAGLARAVEGCKVKKTIVRQPAFAVSLTAAEDPCAAE
ncbi:MAG: OsmC family protein [Polyangiaceae bacterium]|nr:OsmC family protein [Polyangiaceae bacterium]